MKKNINEAFSTEESSEIYDKFLSIVGTRRDNLVKRYGTGAEQVAYATAVNQVKKKAANKTEEPMENTKLKEMVKAALTTPTPPPPNISEENMGLAYIEEMGYEDGKKAFENIKEKFKNEPDHQAYKKYFMHGYTDAMDSYNLNEESLNEITPSQQKYIDKAAKSGKKLKPTQDKPKEKTQFQKDIISAKRMISTGKSSDEVIKKYGDAAFNAVNAHNDIYSESNLKELAEVVFAKLKQK